METADGGFCKYCVLFGKCGPNELGVPVNKPLANFKKAAEKQDEHFHGKQYHKSAVEAAVMRRFCAICSLLRVLSWWSIECALFSCIFLNKLRSIVVTVILCERQGIALRGHRDDNTCDLGSPYQLW